MNESVLRAELSFRSLPHRLPLSSRHLVYLRQDQPVGKVPGPQPGSHGQISFHRLVAGIHEQQRRHQPPPGGEVLLDEADEFLPHSDWRPGISIARQIHEEDLFVDKIEVDLLCPSRRPAHPRHGRAAQEAVDQTRLADVGSAEKRDLGPIAIRKLGTVLRTCVESAVRDLQAAHGPAGTSRTSFNELRALPYGWTRPSRSHP